MVFCYAWNLSNRNIMVIICKYTKIQTKTQVTISLALEIISLPNKISYFIISKESNYSYLLET